MRASVALILVLASPLGAWPAAAPVPVDPFSLFRSMAAVVSSGARAALEQRLSGALNRPVKIDKLDAGANGVTLTGVTAPDLRIREIILDSAVAPVARFRDLTTTAQIGGRAAPIRVASGRYTFATRRLDADGGTCALPGNNFDFSGYFESTGQGRARFALEASGFHVAGGRAAVDLHGTLGRGLESLVADGTLRVDGLVVDLSKSRSVAGLRQKIAGASVSARALDDLARGGRFERVTGQLRAQTDFYAPVLEEVNRPHRLSRISGPVQLKGGVLTARRLKGDQLSGRATVRLAEKRLDAQVDRLQLGRVTLLDVGLAGSLASPAVSFDRKNVRLDGRPAPTSAAANAAAEILGAREERMSGGTALRILDALLNAGQEEQPRRRSGNLERMLRER